MHDLLECVVGSVWLAVQVTLHAQHQPLDTLLLFLPDVRASCAFAERIVPRMDSNLMAFCQCYGWNNSQIMIPAVFKSGLKCLPPIPHRAC